MAEQTGIEWCDATFNPWWGCERVSPGCAHCYADTLARRRAPGQSLWGAGHGFQFFGDKHWAEPLKWARTLPGKLGRRPRVFCASMADVFEERWELGEPRARLFDLIARSPELDWLLLTKRPESAQEILGDDLLDHPNVWLGVSIENARFTWRADVLRQIPAAVRFISAEPLLGSLYDRGSDEDADRLSVLQGSRRGDGRDGDRPAGGDAAHAVRRVARGRAGEGDVAALGCDRGSRPRSPSRAASDPLEAEPEVPQGDARLARRRRAPLDLSGIDWVIVGGESGPGARPFHLEHAREIIRACRARCFACVAGDRDAPCEHRPAVFVKQLGSKPVSVEDRISHRGDTTSRPAGFYRFLNDRKGGDPAEWPADLRVREFPAVAE